MKSDSECILKSTIWDLGLNDELDVEDDEKKGMQTSCLRNYVGCYCTGQMQLRQIQEFWQTLTKREKLIEEGRG